MIEPGAEAPGYSHFSQELDVWIRQCRRNSKISVRGEIHGFISAGNPRRIANRSLLLFPRLRSKT
jgi:hypothetical protein